MLKMTWIPRKDDPDYLHGGPGVLMMKFKGDWFIETPKQILGPFKTFSGALVAGDMLLPEEIKLQAKLNLHPKQIRNFMRGDERLWAGR